MRSTENAVRILPVGLRTFDAFGNRVTHHDGLPRHHRRPGEPSTMLAFDG
jgi:hypothetical protein